MGCQHLGCLRSKDKSFGCSRRPTSILPAKFAAEHVLHACRPSQRPQLTVCAVKLLCCCHLCVPSDRYPVATMRAFVDKLHSQGQKWVPIHDAAVAKVPGYEAFDEGTKWDVWIKEPSGEPYVGQVGPVLLIRGPESIQNCQRPCADAYTA
jgi:hypothetical protein